MYDNPETLDHADLLDVIVNEQSYIPIADHFKYLTYDRDIDARILKAGNAFGLI